MYLFPFSDFGLIGYLILLAFSKWPARLALPVCVPNRCSALPLHKRRLHSWGGAILLTLCLALLTTTSAMAETFRYDDAPPTPIPFDDVRTVICNEPLKRTFVIPDSFLVNDLDLGFNATHSYRSDIRLLLESPKGTRVEVIVEFDVTPEDGNNNYDILLDDDSANPFDNGTADNTNAPYYERTVKPTKPLAAFANERATGSWTLEICDAGVEDGGFYNRSRLIFDGTPIPAGPQSNTISGLLFRDYNADGRHQVRAEGGIANITVTAYADSGAVLAAATTDAAGEYALTVPDGTAVRLEFGALPAYLQPGPAGLDSATTVTFVTSPADGVNVGLANPGQHAQDSAAMSIALPRYAYGAHDGPNAQLETIVTYRETDGSYDLLHGEDADTTVYDGSSTILARQNQTGVIWGMAYDRLHDQLLGAAFVKRHSGLGSTGNPTTIYRFDPTTQGATAWFTLDPNHTDPHGTGVDWTEDFAVYAAVGKEGWGDLDLSDDLRTLYGVDLGTRQLIRLPIEEDGSAGAPTAIDILPALPAALIGVGTGQCPTAADLRPFGLGINDGVVYLGVVCTAESTVAANSLPIQAPTRNRDMGPPPGDFTKLRAYVFAWNGDVTTPAFTQVLDFPLRYPRGCASYNQRADCAAKYPGEWLPWVSAFPYSSDGTATPTGQTAFESFYPQALVSNIEFHNGSMVLFLMDRFGHQVGAFTQSPYGEELNHVAAHSDILFACRRGDGWVMEAAFSRDATCDTGIRAYIRGEERADEYFGEDTYRARYALHGDVGFGAGVAIPGRETVIHAVFDPIYGIDGRGDTLFDGGLHWYSVADGHWRKSIRIYNNITGIVPEEGIFSKANGLGDVVALTDIPPVEIGNRVWLDQNRDGLQSPSEPGIAGVTVALFCPAVGPDGIVGTADDAAVVAAAQTDAGGHYYFSSATGNATSSARYGLNLVNAAACYIQIPNAIGAAQQAALRGLQLTEADDQTPTPGGNDQNDSDGQIAAAAALVNFTLGAPGMNNHTYDFGFFASEPTILHSLGNQVWFDGNDNAQVDSGETGAVGVVLTLYAADDRLLSTTTTTVDGLYLFANLPAGDYRVGVDAGNFAPGGRLAGCHSSSELLDEDDPNADGDNNDNGLVTAAGVRSALLTLGDGEPLGEVPDNDPLTPDARENLTLDFGIFCGHSLGNQVWFDANNNARIDEGEFGIDNVALTLFATNGTATKDDDQVVAQTTTADGGFYLFADLPAGDYYVQLDRANFGPAGVLQRCLSSNEELDEDWPDLDQDNNDNGLMVGDLVRSGVVQLRDTEPLGEDPDNDPFTADHRENLTVDFGCYLTINLGNRVWIDDGRGGGIADNGLLDGSESGVGGVVLALLDGNKQPLLDVNGQAVTTTTDLAGYYLFTDLPPSDYVVQILPINFQSGGVLAGYRSSSSTEEDPNQDEETNDNGIDSATPAIDGICSNVVTLTYATEPGQEPDPGQLPDRSLDTNSNLTIDFGFVAQSPTALVEALEPVKQHRLFLPWVKGR